MNNQSVLILAANQIHIEEPTVLISDAFSNIYSCTDLQTARELLNLNTPLFLIFNHNSVKDSARLYQALFDNRKTDSSSPHIAVLLCKASEVELAYKLCQKEIFDDYIIFKPLHDPYRLNQTLQSLSGNRSNTTRQKQLEYKLADLGKKAQNLHQLLEQSIDDSSAARQQAESAYSNLKDRVIEQVHSIPSQLKAAEWQDAVKVLTPDLLQQRFTENIEQQINNQFQQAEGSVQKTMTCWIDNVKADIASGVEFLTEIEVATDIDPEAESDTEKDTSSKKILVIEDDEVYSSILQSILEEVGYYVIREPDGSKGLKRMALTQPDHVLLDYELPDMTGLDFLKKIKNSKLLGHIPVIMLTGHNNREVVRKSIMGGAKAFIAKPANREIILSKLNQVSTVPSGNKD